MAGVILVVLGTAGCALTPQPFEYHNDLDEKAGRGLFSGDEGGFVIIGDKSKVKNRKEKTSTNSANPVDQIK